MGQLILHAPIATCLVQRWSLFVCRRPLIDIDVQRAIPLTKFVYRPTPHSAGSGSCSSIRRPREPASSWRYFQLPSRSSPSFCSVSKLCRRLLPPTASRTRRPTSLIRSLSSSLSVQPGLLAREHSPELLHFNATCSTHFNTTACFNALFYFHRKRLAKQRKTSLPREQHHIVLFHATADLVHECIDLDFSSNNTMAWLVRCFTSIENG